MPNPHAEAEDAVARFAARLAAAPLPPMPHTPRWQEMRERARLNLQQVIRQMAADEWAKAENAQAWGYTLG